MSSAIAKSDSRTSLLKCGSRRADYPMEAALGRRGCCHRPDTEAEPCWEEAAGGSARGGGTAAKGRVSRKRAGGGGKRQPEELAGGGHGLSRGRRCAPESPLETGGSASPSSSKPSKAGAQSADVDPHLVRNLSPMLDSVYGQV
eukprot:g25462.t1